MGDHGPAKDTIRSNYDRLARWYDLLSGKKEHQLSQDLARRMDFRGDRVVLDIGCGTGRNLVGIAGRLEMSAGIIGLDLSYRMCAIASRRLSRQQRGPLGMVVNGDAWTLPFSSNCVDGILVSFSLELFDDAGIVQVMDEFLRVLRLGGKLGVVCMAYDPDPGLPDRVYRLAHGLFPDIIDCRPIPLGSILEATRQEIVSLRTTQLWGLSVAEGYLIKNRK